MLYVILQHISVRDIADWFRLVSSNMAEISIPMGAVILEICAPDDETAFAAAIEKFESTMPSFVPLDPKLQQHHGLLLREEDAKAIFSDKTVDKYETFRKSVEGGKGVRAMLVELAQQRADLRMEATGRVVVTRRLRVKKRGDPEDTLVWVIMPSMAGAIMQFESAKLHESDLWVENGEYLEFVEKGEMSYEHFCLFLRTWRERKL